MSTKAGEVQPIQSAAHLTVVQAKNARLTLIA